MATAAPPATANANGTKPAARRACDSEIASANRGNSHGTSSSTRITSEPPSTNAAQRRFDAKNASGTTASAATATAPPRAKISGRSA